MRYKYDLHIHTTLSPCCEMLSTPNNILNMAMLAELDFIAITDHNSCKQIPYILEIADSYDFKVISGIEVTVENFHVLCYFKEYDEAKMFEDSLQKFFTFKKFEGEYGEQVIFDSYDNEVETHIQDLNCISITYPEFIKIARKHNALVILAHIDRLKTSVLQKYNLEDIDFDGIEFSQFADLNFKEKYKKYKSISNSDSHCITEIGIVRNYIDLKEQTVECFFRYWK